MRGTHRHTYLLLMLALVAITAASCMLFGGKTSKSDGSGSSASASKAGADGSTLSPSSEGASDGGSSASSSGKIPPAADTNAPSRPEHLVIRASYIADAGAAESSMMELEREGAYKLERRGETSDPKDPGSSCSGTLTADVTGALWKAVDAAAFVPSESGFTKPVQAARQPTGPTGPPQTQQAKYSVIRMLSDLSMVPSDETNAKALINQIRAAMATAEKQAASSGTCTKLPRR